MKKVLAAVIAFAMVFTTGITPFSVFAETNYADYVPGAVPDNLILNPSSANGVASDNTTGYVKRAYADGYSAYGFTAQKDIDIESAISASQRAYYGKLVGTVVKKDGNGFVSTQKLKVGSSYVFVLPVKNIGTTDSVTMNIAMSNSTNYSSAKYSNEYGSSGFTITDKDNYVDFKGTITMPGSTEGAEVPPTVTIGFPDGTPQGAGFAINLANSGVTKMYFAEEKAYDIKVSHSHSEVMAGDSLSADVSILNQIGTTGNVAQGTFKWYAMNLQRTEFVDDFTITPSADTKSVNITVGGGVSSGTYSIVCVSDLYDGFIKGFELKVRTVGDDYIPAPPYNYYGAGTPTAWTRNSTLVDVTGQSVGAQIVTIAANSTYGDSNYYNVDGAVIPRANFTTSSDEGLKPNTTYVISANVRNISSDDVETPPVFKIGIGKDTYGTSFYTNGYLGANGMSVTSSEWMQFKDYITTADTHSGLNIQAGLLKKAGNVVGNAVELDKSTLYIAEEIPYDIVLDSDKSVVKRGGSTFTVNAEIVNQIYLKGNVDQGQFTWYALNGTKDANCEGITVTPSSDTHSAEVTISETVPEGTYFVVASSDTYRGFSKGYRITVYDDEPELKLYVSCDGNDTKRSGLIGSPLKTLNCAKQIIKEIPHKEQFTKIEVIFRGGDYYMDTISFDKSDSGVDGVPIEYKAYEGETVNFKGSLLLDPKSAQKVTDSNILSKFYPQVKDKIKVIDLEEQGVSQEDIFLPEVNGLYSIEFDKGSDYNCVYINGKETLIAQWPNGNHRYANWTTGVDLQSFYYDDKEPDRWSDVSGAWLDCFPQYDFSKARISVKSVDTQNKIISVVDDPVEPFTSTVSKRWKIYNVMEEIDLPGEFYIDRENMLLYIYPTEDFENSTLELSVMSDAFIKINGASHITFDKINFTQSRGKAISLIDVDEIDITNCNFSDISAVAIAGTGSVTAKTGEDYWQFQKKNGVNNSTIKGCTFRNIGASAINLNGGDIDTLTPANTVIEDNYITDCNTRYIINSALMIGGCGVEIRNNNISKSSQHAIHMRGCNFIVENNEIHDVMLDVGDAGAIYIGRNQIYRGTQIRNNYIHDLNPHDDRITNGTVGIYIDDTQSGIDVYNNIVYNARIGYNSNGGNSGKVYNNIFVDCNRSWYFRDHNSIGDLPTANYSMMGTVDDAVNSIYDKDLYFREFPALKEWAETKGNLKKWSVINGNLSVNSAQAPVMGYQEQLYSDIGKSYSASELSGLDVLTQQGSNLVLNSLNSFSDPQNQDFRIVKSSAISNLIPGLVSTDYDIDSIGLKNDITLGDEASAFGLIYPFNNTKVYGKEFELYWDESFGATEYIVTVAKDSTFTDVLLKKTTYTNVLPVDSIAEEGTYYWKVEAVNKSRELTSTWQCQAPQSFSLCNFSYTDVSLTSNDTTVTFNAKITNYAYEAPVDARIFVAIYGSDDNFIASKFTDKTLAVNVSNDISCVFENITSEVEKCIVYVWDKTLKPYSKKEEIK